MGGLKGKGVVVERNLKLVWKDVSIWVEEGREGEGGLEGALERVAREACGEFWVSEVLGLEEGGGRGREGEGGLVCGVEFRSRFVPNNNDNGNNKSGANECYRIIFNPLISNMQAKVLEKKIREKLKNDPIEGVELR